LLKTQIFYIFFLLIEFCGALATMQNSSSRDKISKVIYLLLIYLIFRSNFLAFRLDIEENFLKKVALKSDFNVLWSILYLCQIWDYLCQIWDYLCQIWENPKFLEHFF